jgi:hypothetical protein
MAEAPDIYAELRKNDRYFLAILAAFVLGLLLLFYKDLDPWIKRHFVPAYAVYLLGAALIAQIQNMVGIREQRRCKANGTAFIGSSPRIFVTLVVAHVVWFACWLIYVLLYLWHLT